MKHSYFGGSKLSVDGNKSIGDRSGMMSNGTNSFRIMSHASQNMRMMTNRSMLFN